MWGMLQLHISWGKPEFDFNRTTTPPCGAEVLKKDDGRHCGRRPRRRSQLVGGFSVCLLLHRSIVSCAWAPPPYTWTWWGIQPFPALSARFLSSDAPHFYALAKATSLLLHFIYLFNVLRNCTWTKQNKNKSAVTTKHTLFGVNLYMILVHSFLLVTAVRTLTCLYSIFHFTGDFHIFLGVLNKSVPRVHINKANKK